MAIEKLITYVQVFSCQPLHRLVGLVNLKSDTEGRSPLLLIFVNMILSGRERARKGRDEGTGAEVSAKRLPLCPTERQSPATLTRTEVNGLCGKGIEEVRV